MPEIRLTNQGRTLVLSYEVFQTLDPYAVASYLRGQVPSPLVKL
jgi:hypothetical protein